MPAVKDGALTPKEQRFVEEYCIDFNATAAAARAGYSTKSRTLAHTVLHQPRVAAAIEKAKAKLTKNTEITVERLRDEFWKMYNDANVQDTVRISALTQLGRHLGMFVDKTEHSAKFDGPPVLEVIVKRSGNAA